MKKIFIFLILLLGTALVVTFGGNITGSSIKDVEGKTPITIYKSQSCGCCGLYSDYMDKDYNVNVVNMEDTMLSSKKKEFGIPSFLSSCHTTVVEGYFVEGHIPKEAIDKLLLEKPDIAGIAMPGMPSGSPGMPGSKKEPFTIYAVNKDGSNYEFMTL